MRIHVACLLAVGLLACTTSRSQATEARASSGEASLPFIEDDYGRALAEAKARGLPLFVDTWAPWCHTCRSMKAYVFTDKALARHAERFVWLELNTDLPQAAGFQEKYPVDFWPTFFIIDPREERALVRFSGSATVSQLEKLFEDGERAWRGDSQGAEARLARGDALYGEGRPAEAAEAFAQALAEAPADWSRRGRTLESLLSAQYGAKQHEACARTVLEESPRVPRSASLANAMTWGLGCVLALPPENPAGKALLGTMEARAREVLAPPHIEMPADDRSGLYEMMVEARKALQDEAGTKAIAAEWLGFLEAEAAKAPNPEARTVFDSHRMVAALTLGEPQRVVPAIEQSERDLPGDYNPPARLSNLYRTLGRLEDALAASGRALDKVQGARRLRVLSERSSIQAAQGNKEAAVATLEEALAYAKALPKAQVSQRQSEALEKKLAELKAK
ncbi:thioredoxin family protein [Stigmatella sp. ncwal1]|uniref:Thioredoxin family protein n=1 Tax=Stigmatella ashevillensis TaxID=2995309 RepID=A0ABT5DGJ8_9BACT|nr:thioredoxin family protein [Stigmatella ashevillena]MDC0712785.1 thioredoxin family protein [Stigmatella ashevillena]